MLSLGFNVTMLMKGNRAKNTAYSEYTLGYHQFFSCMMRKEILSIIMNIEEDQIKREKIILVKEAYALYLIYSDRTIVM